MNRLFLLLILPFLLSNCNSEDIENEKIVGGIYVPLTHMVSNAFDVSFMMNDSVYVFNKLDAFLSSHKPTSNRNVFTVDINDSTQGFHKGVELQIFTPAMKPEDFFKKGTLNIDSIRITNNSLSIPYSSITDNFFKIKTNLTWDLVSFEESSKSFRGKGRFILIDSLKSGLIPNVCYPSQTIEFEF